VKITRQFFISCLIHIAVVLLLLLVTVKSTRFLEPEPYRVALVPGGRPDSAPETVEQTETPKSQPEPKPQTPQIITRKVPERKKIKKIETIKPMSENDIKPIAPINNTTRTPGGGKGPRISTGGDSVWDMMVRDKITRNWDQPSKAEVGTAPPIVEYEIVVARSGKITDITLKKSSGIPALDGSALEALRKSDPLPALPKHITGPSRTVPVNFRIQDEF